MNNSTSTCTIIAGTKSLPWAYARVGKPLLLLPIHEEAEVLVGMVGMKGKATQLAALARIVKDLMIGRHLLLKLGIQSQPPS